MSVYQFWGSHSTDGTRDGMVVKKHNFRGVVGSPKVICFTQSSEKHKKLIPQGYCQQWLVNIQKDNRAPMIWNTQMFTFLLSFWTKMYHHGSVSQKDCLSFFHRNHVSSLSKIWCFFNNSLWHIFFGTHPNLFFESCVWGIWFTCTNSWKKQKTLRAFAYSNWWCFTGSYLGLSEHPKNDNRATSWVNCPWDFYV